jgi:uncharacterized membrane protein YjjP (DUF1212 family)
MSGADTSDARGNVALLIKLARALHAAGSPAHRLEDALTVVAAKLGLSGNFFSTPTALFAYLGRGQAQETILVRIEPGGVDLERLSSLEQLIDRLGSDALEPSQADAELDAVLSRPERYGRLVSTLAFAAASGSAALFFGGGLPEMLAAGIVGLVLGGLALLPARWPSVGRVYEPLAAMAAAFLTILFGVHPELLGAHAVAGQAVLLPALIALLPGLTLTVAMTELASRHLVSGSARLSGALITFLTLGFGVALGQWLGTAWLGSPLAVEPAPLAAWSQLVALGVSALAFLVLFRAAPRDLPWILGAAFVALYGARLGTELLGPQLGAFLGAFLVGAGSNLVARFRHRPAAITQLPGLMLLVPGSLGFRSVASLLAQNVEVGVQAAFSMTLVAAALVTGILMANVLVPPRQLL